MIIAIAIVILLGLSGLRVERTADDAAAGR